MLSVSVYVVAIQITLNKVINTGNRALYVHAPWFGERSKKKCSHISARAKVRGECIGKGIVHQTNIIVMII